MQTEKSPHLGQRIMLEMRSWVFGIIHWLRVGLCIGDRCLVIWLFGYFLTFDSKNYYLLSVISFIFSSPGRSPGRAIVLPLALAWRCSACTNGRFGRIYVRKFLSYAENRHQRRPRTSKIVSVCPDSKGMSYIPISVRMINSCQNVYIKCIS